MQPGAWVGKGGFVWRRYVALSVEEGAAKDAADALHARGESDAACEKVCMAFCCGCPALHCCVHTQPTTQHSCLPGAATGISAHCKPLKLLRPATIAHLPVSLECRSPLLTFQGFLRRCYASSLSLVDACLLTHSSLMRWCQCPLRYSLCPDQALMEVYGKLVKCEEAMPVAANEVYLRTWRGRWCFLPAIPCLCGAVGPSSLCLCPAALKSPAASPQSLAACTAFPACTLHLMHAWHLCTCPRVAPLMASTVQGKLSQEWTSMMRPRAACVA